MTPQQAGTDETEESNLNALLRYGFKSKVPTVLLKQTNWILTMNLQPRKCSIIAQTNEALFGNGNSQRCSEGAGQFSWHISLCLFSCSQTMAKSTDIPLLAWPALPTDGCPVRGCRRMTILLATDFKKTFSILGFDRKENHLPSSLMIMQGL